MNKQKIKNLEKSLLNDETENVTCIEVTIIGRNKKPEEILKMELTEPKKTFKKVLIDESGKRIKNPEFVEVKKQSNSTK